MKSNPIPTVLELTEPAKLQYSPKTTTTVRFYQKVGSLSFIKLVYSQYKMRRSWREEVNYVLIHKVSMDCVSVFGITSCYVHVYPKSALLYVWWIHWEVLPPNQIINVPFYSHHLDRLRLVVLKTEMK